MAVSKGKIVSQILYIFIYQTHICLLPNRPSAFSKLGLLSGDKDQKVSIQPIITEHNKNTVYIDVLIKNHSIWIYIVIFCVSNFRLHPKYIYFNPFYSIGAWVKCVCSLPTSIRQFKLQKKLSVCNTFRYL